VCEQVLFKIHVAPEHRHIGFGDLLWHLALEDVLEDTVIHAGPVIEQLCRARHLLPYDAARYIVHPRSQELLALVGVRFPVAAERKAPHL
jgi:hypothetical protein